MPGSPRGPRPYHEGKDVGGVGSCPGSILDLAGTGGCLCVCMCVRARGGGSPLVVHRGQDAEVAVGDRDASVLEGCQRRFALLAAQPDLPFSVHLLVCCRPSGPGVRT
jgi:hypothetical protein